MSSSDFLYFRKLFQTIIFGMDSSAAFSPIFDVQLFAEHHRAMQPGAIGDMIRRYVDLLEVTMNGKLDELAGTAELDLAPVLYDIIVSSTP